MEQIAPVLATDHDPAPALGRGIWLLRELGRQGPLTLEALAARSTWPKTSVARLLQSLEQSGLIARDGSTRAYHAQVRLVPTAVADEVLQHARQALPTLSKQTGQTAELYTPRPDGLVMVDRSEPTDGEVHVRARVGFLRTPEELEAVLQVGLAFDA